MIDHNSIEISVVRNVVVARVIGRLTAKVVQERHDQIVNAVRENGCRGVLFDALASDIPSVAAEEKQRGLNDELGLLNLRIAVVIRNHRMAYLADLVFPDDGHKVFYDDVGSALKWLERD